MEGSLEIRRNPNRQGAMCDISVRRDPGLTAESVVLGAFVRWLVWYKKTLHSLWNVCSSQQTLMLSSSLNRCICRKNPLIQYKDLAQTYNSCLEDQVEIAVTPVVKHIADRNDLLEPLKNFTVWKENLAHMVLEQEVVVKEMTAPTKEVET